MDILKPTVKRDLSLFSIQAWQKGYHYYLKQKIDFRYQIYFNYNGRQVNFYHKEKDFKYFKEIVTQQLIDNPQLFKKLNIQFQKDVLLLKHLTENINPKDISKIFNLIGKVMSLYMFIVSDSFVNKVPSAWESRLLSQEILYEIDHKIEKLITNFYSHVMTKEEIIKVLNNEEIDQIKIYQRSNNYILFNDEIITSQTFKQFCIKQSLENPEELQTGIVSELKGNIACHGKITGKAKIIHAARHLTKIEDGDILVATMTNANYSVAFKKAGAIITDEGGVTSHAAILARELKKPCITGTKIATQIFHDGDLLLVDANSGIISRI